MLFVKECDALFVDIKGEEETEDTKLRVASPSSGLLLVGLAKWPFMHRAAVVKNRFAVFIFL